MLEVFGTMSTNVHAGGMSATAAPVTPKKRKNASDEDSTLSRSATSKSRSKKTADMPSSDLGGNGDDLPQEMDEFIKHKQEWENEYA